MSIYTPEQIAITGSIAALLCLIPWTWKWFITYFITLVHEYGHALIDIITLHGISSIKVFMNGAGETITYREKKFIPLLSALVTFVGYPAPVIFGAFLISLPTQEWGAWAYGGLFLYGLICLIFHRSILGFLVGLLWVASFGFLTFLEPDPNPLILLSTGMIFMIGGMRSFFYLAKRWATSTADETDLQIIKDKLKVPQIITLITMVTVAIFVSIILLF